MATIYLKNTETNLAEIEVFQEKQNLIDISVSVYVKNYSHHLLKVDNTMAWQFIEDFENISELRGWLHEVYYLSNPKNNSTLLIKTIYNIITPIAKRHNLYLSQD